MVLAPWCQAESVGVGVCVKRCRKACGGQATFYIVLYQAGQVHCVSVSGADLPVTSRKDDFETIIFSVALK